MRPLLSLLISVLLVAGAAELLVSGAQVVIDQLIASAEYKP